MPKIDIAAVPARKGSGYPAPFNAPCAERIRKRVLSAQIIAAEIQFGVTVSIGIAEATISTSGIDAMMGAADHALYQAKADGRNRCIAFAPPPPASKAAE